MNADSIKYAMVKTLPTEDVIKLYQEGGWWEENPWQRETIPMLIRGSFCFMAAFYKGKPVGMGRVISDGISDAYIQDVVVLKEFRGLNIGTELVRRMTQFCREQGLEWIGLIAESRMSPFYEKLGFQVLKGYKPMLLQRGEKS